MATIYVHPDFIRHSDVLVDTLDSQQRSIDKLVLDSIAKDPTITIKEIAKLAGVSMATIDRAIKRLKDAGRIERNGSKRDGHWSVRE